MLVYSAELPFKEAIESLSHSEEARAYIVGVFKKFIIPSASDDMSDRSLVVELLNAKERGDFASFQKLGDWALWISSYSMQNKVVADLVGREAYSACYRIVRQWTVFDELSCCFSDLTNTLGVILHSKYNI